MSNSSSVAIIALSLLVLQVVLMNNIIITVRGDPDTNIEDFQCSVERWGQDDPYGALVTQMITDLANECPTAADQDLYVDYSDENGGDAITYGYAECRDGLGEADCSACLGQARQNMFTGCPSSLFVHIVLVDCSMRYDDHPFYDI